jgi:hypothetical protein
MLHNTLFYIYLLQLRTNLTIMLVSSLKYKKIKSYLDENFVLHISLFNHTWFRA